MSGVNRGAAMSGAAGSNNRRAAATAPAAGVLPRVIGISQKLLPEEAFAARLRRLRRCGIGALDLNLSDTGALPYTLPEAEAEVFLARVRAQIGEAGLFVSQIHGPWRWPERDATEEDRAERFEKMRRALRAARLLGTPCMAIHPLYPLGDDPARITEAMLPAHLAEPCLPAEALRTDAIRAEMLRVNREFFARLARAAEEEGAVVCLENMPCRMPLSSPEEQLRFVRELASPALRLCLDTGHANFLGVSPGAFLREAADEVKILHVHDNSGCADEHRLPGEGTVDWTAFSAALRETAWQGVFSLETDVLGAKSEAEYEARLRGLTELARRLSDGPEPG